MYLAKTIWQLHKDKKSLFSILKGGIISPFNNKMPETNFYIKDLFRALPVIKFVIMF